MRERKASKRSSQLADYHCDVDPSPASAPRERSTTAGAGGRRANNVALLSNKRMNDEQYQEPAAAAMRKRYKQIEDACLGRQPADGMLSLEPMPTPPSECAAVDFYTKEGYHADACGPGEPDQQQQEERQQQQRLARLEQQVAALQSQILANHHAGMLPPRAALLGTTTAAAAGSSMQQPGHAVQPDNQQPGLAVQQDNQQSGHAVQPDNQQPQAGVPALLVSRQQPPAGSNEQQQQQPQWLQKLEQEVLQSLQHDDALMTQCQHFEAERQLKWKDVLLQCRQQKLLTWQSLLETHTQLPLADSLRRRLQQQKGLHVLAGVLPLSDESLQFKQLVLQRHQHMLQQWQQLQVDLQEQQQRALQKAAAVYEQFHGDPFAFLCDKPQPSSSAGKQVELDPASLCMGWMQVLREDAA